MLSVKFVPAAEWSARRFLGQEVLVIDEDNKLGSWNGSEYAPVGGSASAAGFELLTAAEYTALESGSALVPGTQYFIAELPAYWLAISASESAGLSFELNGSFYTGDALSSPNTESDLPAGTFATRPTSDPGVSGTVSYRRMTDKGTVKGGNVYRWLNGTSTDWETNERQAPHLGLLTCAEMLAATPTLGVTCDVSDIGNIVSQWVGNGTNWMPRGGEQKIYSLMADTFHATADGVERVNGNAQCVFNAGLLAADGMGFKYRFASYKSGAAESPVVAIRFGPNGSSADGYLQGNTWTMATTTRQLAQEMSAKRASSSTLQGQGAGAVNATGARFGNQTSGARLTALSGLNFAVAQYLSMTVAKTTPFAENMVTDVFDVWITGR